MVKFQTFHSSSTPFKTWRRARGTGLVSQKTHCKSENLQWISLPSCHILPSTKRVVLAEEVLLEIRVTLAQHLYQSVDFIYLREIYCLLCMQLHRSFPMLCARNRASRGFSRESTVCSTSNTRLSPKKYFLMGISSDVKK